MDLETSNPLTPEIDQTQKKAVGTKSIATYSLILVAGCLLLLLGFMLGTSYTRSRGSENITQLAQDNLLSTVSPSPSAAPVAKSTIPKDWKQYVNPALGITFLYPSDYSTNEHSSPDSYYIDIISPTEAKQIAESHGGMGPYPISIRVLSTVGPAWKDTQEYFENEYANHPIGLIAVSGGTQIAETEILKKYLIDGMSAVQIKTSSLPDSGTSAYVQYKTVFYYDGKVFALQITGVDEESIKDKLALSETIVQTIRFSKPGDSP